jgi:hypothetical protein
MVGTARISVRNVRDHQSFSVFSEGHEQLHLLAVRIQLESLDLVARPRICGARDQSDHDPQTVVVTAGGFPKCR